MCRDCKRRHLWNIKTEFYDRFCLMNPLLQAELHLQLLAPGALPGQPVGLGAPPRGGRVQPGIIYTSLV